MGFRYVEAGPLVRSSYHAGRHTQGAERGGYSDDPIFKRGSRPEPSPVQTMPLVQLTVRAKPD